MISHAGTGSTTREIGIDSSPLSRQSVGLAMQSLPKDVSPNEGRCLKNSFYSIGRNNRSRGLSPTEKLATVISVER